MKVLDKSEELIKFGQSRPGEDIRYSLDSTKIRRELKWTPKTDFDEGLRKTIQWYETNIEWSKDISDKVFSHTPWSD